MLSEEAAAALLDQEDWTDIAAGRWPFQRLADELCMDVLDLNWEVRHGAAVALREILRSQAASAAVQAPLKSEPSGGFITEANALTCTPLTPPKRLPRAAKLGVCGASVCTDDLLCEHSQGQKVCGCQAGRCLEGGASSGWQPSQRRPRRLPPSQTRRGWRTASSASCASWPWIASATLCPTRWVPCLHARQAALAGVLPCVMPWHPAQPCDPP